MNYDSRIETPESEAGMPAAEGASDPFDEPADEQRERKRLWIGAAIVAAMLVGLWFFTHREASNDLVASRDSQAPLVSVIAAGRATVEGRISATGTLAARRELPVGVAGEGGQVVQVLVEPGQWVRAGQVLAVIDRSVQVEQQASQAAQIQVAEADARLAQANLDRALQLVERGVISRAVVELLTATRESAQAHVRVSRAQLSESRARTNRLNIVAPASGLVLERRVEPGQVVSSGSGVLFRLARDGEMELLARLAESDLARISAGITASVVPVGSERSFTGQVWQVSPVIDPQTRQGTARIALAYAPELRPGGFASADIVAGTTVAPLLPESAVLSDNAGAYVFVVGKDNKVERRAVKPGMITAAGIVITEGLTGTEQVVERAGAFLAPGETVKPQLVKRSVQG
ncbi:MAG TPA: efflux RND transporter periplasmic adaptor subunit [Novosphingobium sp.]|nr:efflux RND transporter periplasmic adaptor subunit [Novosphingobium sp.]